MTLKHYAKVIGDLAKKHPHLEVAYANDDEGNSYSYVNYQPSVNNVVIDSDEVTIVCVN